MGRLLHCWQNGVNNESTWTDIELFGCSVDQVFPIGLGSEIMTYAE